MTDTRITATQTLEWTFCPWCGRRLELDQDLDGIVRDEDGDVDVDASADNGFQITHSVKHCGYHIRLWIPEFADAAELEV